MRIEIDIPDKIFDEVIAANAARFKGNRLAMFKRMNKPAPELNATDLEVVKNGIAGELIGHVKRLRMHTAGKDFDKELTDGNDNQG